MDVDEEEEQFNQAFGEVPNPNISRRCRDGIRMIKDNDEDFNLFNLEPYNADRLTNQQPRAWELLGRYIANNTNLRMLDIGTCGVTDEMMALLFKELVRSVSLHQLHLNHNDFGIVGIRCMLPFLESSSTLHTLNLTSCRNVDTDCFEVLISALDGKPIKELYLNGCDIFNISSLNTYNLPNLQRLNLRCNNIGIEGCITISNLLQKEGSTLTHLNLTNTGIDDDGAEIIASSLKQNTKLKELEMIENSITNRGCLAFFKLLNDVSSIDNTYNSNHTLKTINIAEYVTSDLLDSISEACIENRTGSSPNSIGRSKVIKTQLKGQNREKYCKLQGIQCPSNIFADIEPNLLPNILTLIGESHGQTELYTALVPTAPDLLSYIDRKALLTNALSKIDIEYEMIKAKRIDLKKRLALLDVGDSKPQAVAEAEDKEVALSGKKRGRKQET